jgi:hypothetical protein
MDRRQRWAPGDELSRTGNRVVCHDLPAGPVLGLWLDTIGIRHPPLRSHQVETRFERLPGLRTAMARQWGGGVFAQVLDKGEVAVGDQVEWE